MRHVHHSTSPVQAWTLRVLLLTGIILSPAIRVHADEVRRTTTSASSAKVADTSEPQQLHVSDDQVTEYLFWNYLAVQTKIPSSSVNAAIELVAARGTSATFRTIVLREFEKSCEAEDRRIVRRNLLAVMTKMLLQEGSRRWHYEHVRRTGEVGQSATIEMLEPSPRNDEIMYRESEMLERLIVRGRQADRHDIDAFVLAARQAHHPQARQFFLDVLRNPPTAQGAWPDNLGGTWLNAKFHAAVALAELGEPAGVDWLLAHVDADGGESYLDRAPHARATRSTLHESCIQSLAELSGLTPNGENSRWATWWATNRDQFEPQPISLRVD